MLPQGAVAEEERENRENNALESSTTPKAAATPPTSLPINVKPNHTLLTSKSEEAEKNLEATENKTIRSHAASANGNDTRNNHFPSGPSGPSERAMEEDPEKESCMKGEGPSSPSVAAVDNGEKGDDRVEEDGKVGGAEAGEEPVSARNSCCLCWCCCCTCTWEGRGNHNGTGGCGTSSCASTSGEKLASPSRSLPTSSSRNRKDSNLALLQQTYFCDIEPRPSLEEIRSWGKSFEKLMKSPAGRNVFREFLRCEYSEENILFWIACEELKKELNPETVEEKARFIYEDYISILSPKEVSLDSRVREIVNKNMLSPTPNTFDEAQLQIYTLMHRDSYPRFVNSPMFKQLAQHTDENGSDGNLACK